MIVGFLSFFFCSSRPPKVNGMLDNKEIEREREEPYSAQLKSDLLFQQLWHTQYLFRRGHLFLFDLLSPI